MEWISVKDRLPEIIEDKDGSVNGVIAYYNPEMLGDNYSGFLMIVSNTRYFNRNKDMFTHWMPLPPPPEETKQ